MLVTIRPTAVRLEESLVAKIRRTDGTKLVLKDVTCKGTVSFRIPKSNTEPTSASTCNEVKIDGKASACFRIGRGISEAMAVENSVKLVVTGEGKRRMREGGGLLAGMVSATNDRRQNGC